MSVQKAVDLVGTGDSIQEAVMEVLDRAQMSLEGITGFDVQHIAGVLEAGQVSYRVELRVWFTVLERMHG